MAKDEIQFSVDALLNIKSDCLFVLDSLVHANAGKVELMVAARILRVMQHLDLLDKNAIKYLDILRGNNKDKLNFIILLDEEVGKAYRKPVLVK